MKLFHLSDLHIGKRVNEFSMIEDQKYILTQILYAADQEKPDGILISGEVRMTGRFRRQRRCRCLMRF